MKNPRPNRPKEYFKSDIKLSDVGIIKNNKITIDFYSPNNGPSYEEYGNLIKKLKEKYDNSLKKIKDRLKNNLTSYSQKDFSSIIADHEVLITETVRDLIGAYEKIINSDEFAVFWTGGFARKSNRIGGDFDLNFIYPDKKRNEYLPIEEQICYALSKISGKPRDYVHAAMTHDKKSSEATDSIDKSLSMSYRMNWNDSENHKIEYKISRNLECLSWRVYSASRSDKSLESKLLDSLAPTECFEWAHVIKPVFGDNLINNIYSSAINKERAINNEGLYLENYHIVLTQARILLEKTLEPINGTKPNKVKDIKTSYKTRPLNSIFSVLALIRRYLIIEGIENNLIDLESYSTNSHIRKVLGEDLSNELFEQIYVTIWSVARLESIFEMEGIRFGSHSTATIDKQFNEIYKKEYPDIGEDFHSFHYDTILRTCTVLDKVITRLRQYSINKTYNHNFKYNVFNEYINIANYSPFWFRNEVSPQYRYGEIEIPFIKIDKKDVPMHPDTFSDLNINAEKVSKTVKGYPTSSYRSVYIPSLNVCYKLPLQRHITRGLRDISDNEIKRSTAATKLLTEHPLTGFAFLPEKCFPNKKPEYNYIIRKMPEKEVYPWFYAIVSNEFSNQFLLTTAKNIIKTWIYYASKGIFLEYHTQNVLIDKDSNIYYRDLSDTRSFKNNALVPSYAKGEMSEKDTMAMIFDRTLCKQNLEHLFRYNKSLTKEDKEDLKEFIKHEIKKYKLDFPSYSFDFPHSEAVRVPQKNDLIYWRA